MSCAPREDLDQPGHPPCLIRVFADSMKKKAWVLSYSLRLIWVFAGPFCWFCRALAQTRITCYFRCLFDKMNNATAMKGSSHESYLKKTIYYHSKRTQFIFISKEHNLFSFFGLVDKDIAVYITTNVCFSRLMPVQPFSTYIKQKLKMWNGNYGNCFKGMDKLSGAVTFQNCFASLLKGVYF